MSKRKASTWRDWQKDAEEYEKLRRVILVHDLPSFEFSKNFPVKPYRCSTLTEYGYKVRTLPNNRAIYWMDEYQEVWVEKELKRG